MGNNPSVASSIPKLVRIVSTGTEAKKLKAMDILNYGAWNEDDRILITESGGIRVLVQLLSHQSEVLQVAAASALRVLAVSDNNQILISDEGGINYLINMLTHGSVSAQAQAAGLLGILARNVNNSTLISKEGGTTTLLRLLSHESEIVRESAAAALQGLSYGESGALIAKEGGIQLLIQLLSHGSERAKGSAAGALWSLSRNESNRNTIAEYGGIQALIQSLPEGNKAKKWSIIATLSILAVDFNNTITIATEGGIRRLVQLLSNSETRLVAADALWKLAINNDNKVLIANEGGINPLIDLLTSESERAQEIALGVLCALAINEENQTLIVREGGIRPLIHLLSSNSHDIKEKSATLLQSFAANSDRRIDIARSGGIEHLAQLMTDHAPTVATIAATTLHLLSTTNTEEVVTAIRNLKLSIDASQITEQSSRDFTYSIISSSIPAHFIRLIIQKRDITLLNVIGEESQGILHQAQWNGLPVIYKQLPKLPEEIERDEFIKECAIWSTTSHPSCVKIHGVVYENQELGLVVECCDEGSLYLDRKIYLRGAQTIEFALNLAHALNSCHKNRLVHRDIKSANVMLDQNLLPKLGYLRSVYIIDMPSSVPEIDGNLFYPPPEVLSGNMAPDQFASDIYSFGILMHEIASNTVVSSRDPAPVKDKPEGLSRQSRDMWWGLVKECTQETPELRPTVLQVISKLEQIQFIEENRSQATSPQFLENFKRFIIKKSDVTLKGTIGEGAQAIVHLAEWNCNPVVYKQVKLSKGNERENFMREFEVWLNAAHQSCVSLYGFVNEGDEFGFVAEYCPEGSLDKMFEDNIVLSGVKTIEFSYNLAHALNTLHGKKIAHRDIKSANVMLDQNFKPKLGDFGASKMLSTMVGGATIVGTLYYIAPEIIFGSPGVDLLKADVYSFGILMCELSTNKLVTSREIHPAKDKPEGFSKEARDMWWNLVKACTETSPALRPTMNQVFSSLQQIMRTVTDFKCKKHGKMAHQVFISYRVATDKDLFIALENASQQYGMDLSGMHAFLDSECLPDGEDWQKSFLYGLQNSTIMVPIISAEAWERMKEANKTPDNVLKEYEHMLNQLKTNMKTKVFPWVIGSTPRLSNFPEDPHIYSGLSIRATLTEIMRFQGARKTKQEAAIVAAMIMAKTQELDAGANLSYDPAPMNHAT